MTVFSVRQPIEVSEHGISTQTCRIQHTGGDISIGAKDATKNVTFTGEAPTTTTTSVDTSTPTETAAEITVADGVADLADVATGNGSRTSSRTVVAIVSAVVALAVVVGGVQMTRRRTKSNER